LSKWFRKASRIAETVKAREVAKQEKYLKLAKRFLDEAISNGSAEPKEKHEDIKR
jgi:DUF1680 family protein